MADPTDDELIPGGFRRPQSLFVGGPQSTLVKWVTLALLTPYVSRVYWTEVRPSGTPTDPLDPLRTGAVPEERIHVVLPSELQREEQAGRQAEVAAATVLRSDEPPEYLRRLTEFLRLPVHTQERISATTASDTPPILIASNAQHLTDLYPDASIVPTVHAFLEAGASLVLLWEGTPPPRRTVFDMVLHLDGSDPAHWRDATLRCEKGITEGQLAVGKTPRLADLPSVRAVLEGPLRASHRS